jgi:hypothetical protein
VTILAVQTLLNFSFTEGSAALPPHDDRIVTIAKKIGKKKAIFFMIKLFVSKLMDKNN